jgi:branched-chain amino acid transport system permease protein
MTVTATPITATTVDTRWSPDVKRIVSKGAVCALVMVFICLVGMPVKLDPRPLIDPILSRGYTSLVWVPVAFGYMVTSHVVLEGMAARRRGIGDLVEGALVGVIGGLGVGILAVLIDNFDLRDPLVHWSPQLYELITFGNGTAFGIVIWVVIGALCGAGGAAMHLLPRMIRTVVATIVLAIVGMSFLETASTDLLQNLKLEFVSDGIYAKQGGLTTVGAFIVAVIAGVVISAALYLGEHRQNRQTERDTDEPALVTGASLTPAGKALAGRTNREFAVGAIAIAVILILPQFLGGIMNELLANVGLFLLLALGLNVVVGLAGILDLGYVAFFAVGGYTTAVLTSPNAPWLHPELPWFVALLVVIVMGAIVGLVIGAPVIRMRGDYLAIVTLGFGEIIRLLFLSDWLSPRFGGAQGITNIPGVQIFGLATVKGTDPRAVFYLVMGFCAVAIYVSWRLERSRLGRAWMAIREDEKVAEAMGINTVNAKLAAFVTGAILASFSGAIFAAKVGSIFPNSFEILVSVIILVIVIVGGMGRIAGVALGAVVLIGILGGPSQPGLLQELSEYKLLIYGALLVWMMLKRPEGLIPNVRRSRELHHEELSQDAWLKAQEAGIDDDEPAEAEIPGWEAPA